MSEIKVGDWTLTPAAIERLGDIKYGAAVARRETRRRCRECCEILGIDPEADSVARDICEEIVLHGTPVDEVIKKLQRHLEAGP